MCLCMSAQQTVKHEGMPEVVRHMQLVTRNVGVVAMNILQNMRQSTLQALLGKLLSGTHVATPWASVFCRAGLGESPYRWYRHAGSRLPTKLVAPNSFPGSVMHEQRCKELCI